MKMDDLQNKNNIPAEGKLLISTMSDLKVGSLEITLPSKQHVYFKGQQPGATGKLSIHDWRMAESILRKGDIGAAESFILKYWDSPNLTNLLEVIGHNRNVFTRVLHGQWKSLLLYKVKDIFRQNTTQGAKKNIHDHYDIGNNFYKTWLDKTMTYSAAIFSRENNITDLFSGQISKYNRIIDRLNISKDDHVLEIGCGWGGFAIHCARTRKPRIDAITISDSQYDYVIKNVLAFGLDTFIKVILKDYRKIKNQYDHIVSIEMFEAVGRNFWKKYFKAIESNLKPGGKAIVQTIVIRDDLYQKYIKSTDFIRQYIFPGGALPSASIFEKKARESGLNVTDRFYFGKDYARTLDFWLKSYKSQKNRLKNLGFDERFNRLWTFYLSYCQSGFKVGDISVVQFELAKT